MRFKPLLGRLVVVGHHHQGTISPESGRLTNGLDGLGGAVAAGAGQNLGAVPHGRFDRREQLVLLIPAEGGRFASGAANHQAIGTVIHQMAGQVGRHRQIHRAIGRKRGDHRGDHTAKGGRRERAWGQGGAHAEAPAGV